MPTIDQIVAIANLRIAQCDKDEAKFLEKAKKDMFQALTWADGLFYSTAVKSVHKQILILVASVKGMDKDEDFKVKALRKSMEIIAHETAAHLSYSTSQCSNQLNVQLVRAWGSVIRELFE